MADAPTCKVETQFQEMVTKLADHAQTMTDSRLNEAQPKWADLGEKADTRKELLKTLDRKDLNEHIKQAHEKGQTVPAGTTVVLTLQHDWLAGMARDVFHLRRSRLARFLNQANRERGMGDENGVLRGSVLGYLQKLVKANT